MNNLVWKGLLAASTVAAGFVASKLTDQVWRTTGQDDVDPHDPDSPMLQAVAYAALAGLMAAALRTYSMRKAAQYYAKSTGHLPPEVEASRRESA